MCYLRPYVANNIQGRSSGSDESKVRLALICCSKNQNKEPPMETKKVLAVDLGFQRKSHARKL